MINCQYAITCWSNCIGEENVSQDKCTPKSNQQNHFASFAICWVQIIRGMPLKEWRPIKMITNDRIFFDVFVYFIVYWPLLMLRSFSSLVN